jgi:hypothetical protein
LGGFSNFDYHGFDSGKQWQSDLGGNQNWKNHPTHENGEHSMLIDINGDSLPDRVFIEYSPLLWVGRFFQF